MRKQHFSIFTMILLFLVLTLFSHNVFSQNQPPLTLEQIKSAVGFVKNKQITARKLINDIRKRKVDFSLTKEEEAVLRAEGATYEIIKAIIDNFAFSKTNPTQTADAKPIPYTIPEINDLLIKENSPEAQAKLILLIKNRKVSGELLKTTEDFLRADGAIPELIEAIKQNPYIADTATVTTPLSGEFKNQKSGMEFVVVPKGSFMMGSELVENESPMRRVTFAREFLIGKYEVTQGEWQAVMGNAEQKVLSVRGENKVLDEILGENYPMVGVNWYDAKEFIAKLNEANDGYIYSLPSEAEWEYACRAGTDTRFAFGDNITTNQASFYNYSFIIQPKRDTPDKEINKLKTIGLYQPNAWGIFDMHGNVWEWCEDIFTFTYTGLRVDGTANTTKGEADRRIVRGGGWTSNSPAYLRSTYRDYKIPNFANLATGFRVVARRK